MLSPPEDKRPIMSARARRRLINTALTEHPVALETMRTYDAVLLFSRNMVQWLDGEGLSEEANLVKSVKPVILNQVTGFNTLESDTCFIFSSQRQSLSTNPVILLRQTCASSHCSLRE